jgi:hypothetical protein
MGGTIIIFIIIIYLSTTVCIFFFILFSLEREILSPGWKFRIEKKKKKKLSSASRVSKTKSNAREF